MKYIQQNQKSHVSVLTDAPINLSSSCVPIVGTKDTIVEMRYDRESDSFVPSRPSRIVYPKARKLVEQYRREYAERLR